MPIKRVRNLKRAWYAETLDKIMPPLPEAEWDELHMRASGKLPWEGPVVRRKWVGGPDDEGQSHVVGERLIINSNHSNPHKITRKYMRRLWAKLFEQCPVMKPNAARNSATEILWGDVYRLGQTRFELDSRGRCVYDMFGGVNERGKVIA